MTATPGTVLVLGATGQQGGATALALLQEGRRVRALVRDPGAATARSLAAAGADLVAGDLDDTASLERAVEGVDGLFCALPLAVEPDELVAEVRRGTAVVEAAETAGVRHLVYSSVGGAERETGIDHFETKAAVEARLLRSSVPATVLRPTFFMENLLWYADAGEERVMELPVVPDRPMQMVATSDIGRVAAVALGDPGRWIGERLELAGDELSFEEVARVYAAVTGTPTRLVPQPVEERMFEWFAESGYRADLHALRARFGWLLRFEGFLRDALRSRVPA